MLSYKKLRLKKLSYLRMGWTKFRYSLLYVDVWRAGKEETNQVNNYKLTKSCVLGASSGYLVGSASLNMHVDQIQLKCKKTVKILTSFLIISVFNKY